MSIFSDLFLCACNVSMEVKAFQHPHSTWLSMFLANFWWLNLKHPKCGSGRESSSKNVVVSPLENHKSILFLDGPETISSFDAPFVFGAQKKQPVFSNGCFLQIPWHMVSPICGGSGGRFHFGGLSTTLGRVCQSHADGFGFQHLRASGWTNSEIFEGCFNGGFGRVCVCVYEVYILFRYELR